MDNYLGSSKNGRSAFNKSDYRKEVEDELSRQKSNNSVSQYQRELHDKESYIRELEATIKDLKAFLAEYKKMNDDKDYLIKQKDSENQNLNHSIYQLEKKIQHYENNDLAKQRIIDAEVDKEKFKNKEIIERFNQKFTFFEEQIQVLENQLLEKNRYIIELEINNKDLNFAQSLVEEKQTLIESLRRENQVLIRRIREQFRDQNFGQQKFDLEEEKRFVQDIIKKKEEQGLFADGFISKQKNDQQIYQNARQQQNIEADKRYKANEIQTLSNYNSIPQTTELQYSQSQPDNLPYQLKETASKNEFRRQLSPSEAEKEEIRLQQERLEQLKLKYKQGQV